MHFNTGKQIDGEAGDVSRQKVMCMNFAKYCYTVFPKIVSRMDFSMQQRFCYSANFWLDEKKISKQKKLLEKIIKYDNTYSIKERAQVILCVIISV